MVSSFWTSAICTGIELSGLWLGQHRLEMIPIAIIEGFGSDTSKKIRENLSVIWDFAVLKRAMKGIDSKEFQIIISPNRSANLAKIVKEK